MHNRFQRAGGDAVKPGTKHEAVVTEKYCTVCQVYYLGISLVMLPSRGMHPFMLGLADAKLSRMPWKSTTGVFRVPVVDE